MSWSFNAVGRSKSVLVKAQKDLAAIKCSEPEQTIKSLALGAIEASLSAMPETSAVKIAASGSQSASYQLIDGSYKEVSGLINSLSLTIEPMYGFVE